MAASLRTTLADRTDEFEELRRTADQVEVGEGTERWARVGFVGRGVLYLVVGALAFRLAWSSGAAGGEASDEASKEGAVRAIAEQPFGRALLIALAVSLGAYALWRFGEALWGSRSELRARKRTAKRLLSAGKGLVYLALLATTVRVLLDEGSGAGRGSGTEESWTARALGLPGGQVLVAAAAVLLLGAALWLAHRAFSKDDARRLDTSEMGPRAARVADVVGMVGLIGRAGVLALLATLLLQASLDEDPTEAAGLDEALRSLLDQAHGRWVVTALAVGLACYGLYSWIEARYRRL